ncbi:hypothetical protein P3F01_15675 [Clostridium perfringens]|nr:hypothetical protein [Clostridium perfringens]MDT9337799.1 hypothetical protein [Clostridium perfringens]MDT9345556.1 hypothetical protein [Clostridium perfringens]MDT9348799.1 hypothetical protein [Clostridium perfringens]MDT9354599.1 hypothetical protein [Clostridium perfringens]
MIEKHNIEKDLLFLKLNAELEYELIKNLIIRKKEQKKRASQA